MRTLRPYQRECIDAILSTLQRSPRCVAVLPTGLGKTVVAAHLVKEWQGGNILFMAHTQELIQQSAAKIGDEIGVNPHIEMNIHGAEVGTLWQGDMVVVGSVQSMMSDRRLRKYRPYPFDLIIVDECHHATAASYVKVIDYFQELNPALKVVGITATPNRTDETALGLVFNDVAYTRDIAWAVSEGWLVPFEQLTVTVQSLDLDSVKVKTKDGVKDFNREQLEERLTEERVLHEMATPILNETRNRQAIIFTAGVQHAHALAEILNAHRQGCAAAVDGTTDPNERRGIVRRFSAGELQYVLNFGVFTEGFDAPATAAVVMGRPTKSVSLYCLSHDTEILTNEGWVGLSDWDRIGAPTMKAAGYRCDDGSVVWTDIKGKYRRPLNESERMFSLESRQTSVRVTESHRLLYRKAGSGKPFALIAASELAKRKSEYEIPVSGIQEAPGVPLSNADIEFIGWMMTDGSVHKTNRNVIIRQASFQPWIPRLESTIKDCGFKYTKREFVRSTQFSGHAPTVSFTISFGKPRGRDKNLTGWGRLEPYYSKDLSPLLEDMTADQLGVLLDAMHLGDGTKFAGQPWTRRSYHISTGRKLLADRLQSLCVRRGFRCSVAEHRYNAKPLYMLHIKRMQYRHVGGSCYQDRPTLAECPTEPGEIVWCVTTGTGTIVTRRNGKVTLMGQTQMLGRGLRPLPGTVDGVPDSFDRQAAIATSPKHNCLILDFVGASRNGVVDCYDVLGGNYDVEVRQLASDAARNNGRTKVTADDLELAKNILALRRALMQREQILIQSTYRMDAVEAGRMAGMGLSASAKRGGATDSQVALLQKLGVARDKALSYTKKQAGAVIDSIGKTKCTSGQAWLLQKAGINPAGIGMGQASKLIDELKAKGAI